MNLGDVVGGEVTVRLQLGVQLPRPQSVHVAGGEVSAEQRPVRFDEAQDPVHRHAVLEDSAHDFDLMEYSVDQHGAVAGADKQALDGGRKSPASILRRGRPRYFLASMT